MKLRRTMLYLPGNNPNMLLRGYLFGSDGIVMDLEDAVPVHEKDAARHLIREVVRRGEFGDCEVTVRINGTDTDLWREDLETLVPLGLNGIRVPKVETADQIKMIDEVMGELEEKAGIEPGRTGLCCLLETAVGIWNAYEIATAAKRVDSICPGGEDLTADLHTNRSPEGVELEGPRRQVLMAARAAGVDAFDTVYPMVNDDEGLRREVEFIKQLAFDCKSVIHPRQVPIIHDVFMPTPKQIDRAQRIVAAAKDAAAKGLGAVQVDGRMVDAPVVKRAMFTLSRAGLLEEAE